MSLKKFMVILLLIYGITGIAFEIAYFHVPSWIKHLYLPEMFDLCHFAKSILRILSYLLIFWGGFKLILLKKIELLNIFKYPIFHFVTSQIFLLTTTLMSTKYSFFILPDEAPRYLYALKVFDITLILTILLYYLKEKKHDPIEAGTLANRTSRFFNYLVDMTIILSFNFWSIKILFDGFLFEDVPFLNSNPYWFIAINIFLYYFVLEFVFLQTIGKLHNNSFVTYRKNKFQTILTRTICRFIPFEAFSFFSDKGWHDRFSGTEVIITGN